ncbi:uncharacterized protein LOC125557593 [Nematostella vectensis]|uniref:uncharacterized protein LOC125557593 n=1 Tax=Nematostella vectensis TaxID=45351 RepID=UPI0020773CCE|nr:uncharacterized protein LOC125557593 [Nematostella vectensis]
MVVIECTVPDCEFKTTDASEVVAIALLANHNLVHRNEAQPGRLPANTALKGPKLDRPKIDVSVTMEEWNIFTRRWEVIRAGSGIDENSAPSQLFQCAGTELEDSILKANPNAANESLTKLMKAMRSLSIIPIATCVLRTELLQMRQERDESFRSFTAKVRGKAETCAYNAKCSCSRPVDYTDHVIRDVIINGLYDNEIRREVLGIDGILEKPINQVIAVVESKEMARNALPPSHSLSAVSSFQRQKTNPPHPAPSPPQADQAKEATCPGCQKTFKLFTEGARGWNKKPHQLCIDCHRVNRRSRRSQRQPQQRSPQAPTVHATQAEPIAQISSLHGETKQDTRPTTHATTAKRPVRLDHHIFSKGEWKRARFRDHPRLPITISLARKGRHRKETADTTPDIQAAVSAIADTGAQSDLWSLADFLACGFSREELQPIRPSLTAANNSPISIEGAFFAKLSATSYSGQSTTSFSMVYVSSSVRDMYLSYDSLLNLDLLPHCFPRPDDVTEASNERQPASQNKTRPNYTSPTTNAARIVNEGCTKPASEHDVTCSCPQRETTPPRPSELPFPCTPANNTKMKAWLLNRYSSSTFNTCPHRALPCMEGPPLHVDATAKPTACHTPANIPLHWQKRVYEDLLRDEALGVVERVPYGEPVTWCHRMVVTRKHDGSPRRTVDLSPLNKYCQRETYATESPFQLARRIPNDTWKTVTDAWNGYHSVPLRSSDRHLTTFLTPFGRWPRAPQGFLSSGDGYNRRFDAILAEFERKERCVDDTVHYDHDLEQHWWRTIEFLTRVGQAGIVNPDKFQFAGRSVNFAGFHVSDHTIELLPKYLDAIREFPTPTSTTDIRSWFGLVNQVSNYAQLRDLMAPFKPFLFPATSSYGHPSSKKHFKPPKKKLSKPSAREWRFLIYISAPAYAPIGPSEGSDTFYYSSTAVAPPACPTAVPGDVESPSPALASCRPPNNATLPSRERPSPSLGAWNRPATLHKGATTL